MRVSSSRTAPVKENQRFTAVSIRADASELLEGVRTAGFKVDKKGVSIRADASELLEARALLHEHDTRRAVSIRANASELLEEPTTNVQGGKQSFNSR